MLGESFKKHFCDKQTKRLMHLDEPLFLHKEVGFKKMSGGSRLDTAVLHNQYKSQINSLKLKAFLQTTSDGQLPDRKKLEHISCYIIICASHSTTRNYALIAL